LGEAHGNSCPKRYQIQIEGRRFEQYIVDTLEPVLNQHRLIVDPAVIKADYESVLKRDGERAQLYRLFYQLARMVRAKGALAQDDRLDALAMAVAYWERQAARDVERAKQEHYEAQLDAELAKFMEHALGGKTAQTRVPASSTLRKASKGK
jgi:hypothetical protein